MSTCTQTDKPLRCSACKETKARCCFGINRRRSNGLQTECRECRKKKNSQSAEQRDARRAALRSVSFEKVCSTCRKLKSQGEYTNHAGMRDGLFNECNECKASRQRRNKYSLTKDRFEEMRATGVCQMPGCGEPLEWAKTARIDHCHTTGKVREVLCHRCNVMLGYVQKTPHLLQPMLNYIAKHKADNEAA
jgi:hypothetical protein